MVVVTALAMTSPAPFQVACSLLLGHILHRKVAEAANARREIDRPFRYAGHFVGLRQRDCRRSAQGRHQWRPLRLPPSTEYRAGELLRAAAHLGASLRRAARDEGASVRAARRRS